MPIATLKLRPGVNVEATQGQNEAGISSSNLVRTRGGLTQKLGGWEKFYPFAIGGVPRALHAWQDLNGVNWLSAGTTTTLVAINSSSVLSNITPQQLTIDTACNISTTSGSTSVTITDAEISNVTVYDCVTFNTPVAIGGLILSGTYPISLVLGATSYQITASSAATATRASVTVTGATNANPCVVTAAAHGFSNGDLIYFYGVGGMTQLNGNLYEIANVTANTFELSGINSTAYGTYTSGGTASPSRVPKLSTTSGSSTVSVTLQDHGVSQNDKVVFPLSTTVGGVAISGTYVVTSISGTDAFTITAANTASSTATAMMNGGESEYVYTISLGPAGTGTGYGIGGYGSGGYGTGTTSSAQTGTDIAATDWTLDNWGDTLIACPKGGSLFYWAPNGGFSNMTMVGTGPTYNTGSFVASPARILVAYGSSIQHAIGTTQDPLVIRTSDIDDFSIWTTSTTNQARTFRIPNGSRIVRGMRAGQKNLFWTDIDLWSFDYINFPLVFRLNRIGPKAGLIGAHAVAEMAADVFWMGRANFFRLGANGLTIMPCPVWDAAFQDMGEAYQSKATAWANTPANEIWWFYPSAIDATTEPSRYVKYNVVENTWDYGIMARSAAIDQSEAGMPIAASPSGIIYQHETTRDADGQPIAASFETGWFAISEGAEMAFVDWILPDFKWDLFGGANSAEVSITVKTVDYLGETPRTDGPHQVTKSTQSVNPRIRGRFMALSFASEDAGSFWRVGAVKYRFAPDGRR